MAWHEGFIHKLRYQLPKSFCDFYCHSSQNDIFRVKQQDANREFKLISDGVPQSSNIVPILYLLHTSNVPTSLKYMLANDTIILTIAISNAKSTEARQTADDCVISWPKKSN